MRGFLLQHTLLNYEHLFEASKWFLCNYNLKATMLDLYSFTQVEHVDNKKWTTVSCQLTHKISIRDFIKSVCVCFCWAFLQ